MTEYVKLTVRLPSDLHQRLKQRAQQRGQSLNKTILETLEFGLDMEKHPEETERERFLRLLREDGMIDEPEPGWNKYAAEAPRMRHAELREMLKGLPPISDLIIDDREPR